MGGNGVEIRPPGRPKDVLLVRSRATLQIAATLARELRWRGLASREAEFGTEMAVPSRYGDTFQSVVALLPPGQNDDGEVALASLADWLERGSAPIVVAPVGTTLPKHLRRVKALVRYDGPGLTFDRVFEGVLKALLGPFPPWLDAVVRPSQIEAPTGVTWWSEELFVSDERYEHVVRISPDGTTVLVPGLAEPHHIHLDRRKLLIANKGADELVLADVAADLAGHVRHCTQAGGTALLKPSGVHQSHGLTAVADTDNHRVMVTADDFWRHERDSDWRPLDAPGGFRFPVGVFVSGNRVWVADTFHHRVVAFDHEGRFLAEAGGYGSGDIEFRYPVGLLCLGRVLFVVDEEGSRIRAFDVSDDQGNLHLKPLPDLPIASLGTPFAMTVNRERRLAISDRDLKLVWIVDWKDSGLQATLAGEHG